MITGTIQTPVGSIPLVATKLSYADYWGAVKVRWGINRNKYRVEPGIYAVGCPTKTSDVFVTANYKLSFDHLRKNLDGLDAWILVLDTKGVNVWCAAGKGTFGTTELVNRIKISNLGQVVTHRHLILPQLGAVGIAAHIVKKQTEDTPETMLQTPSAIPSGNTFKKAEFQAKLNQGFTVTYGPVRASDIKPFINSGYKATKKMRSVTFTFKERAKLIPVDLVYGKYYLLISMALLLILSGLNKTGISFSSAFINGTAAMFNIFMAYIAGIVITPLLLPYIPVRPFALKGFLSGLILWAILLLAGQLERSILNNIAWFLLITALSSFVAMNFTGSSTYTSLSGVKKEMKIAVPLQITFAASGLILFTISKLI